MGTERSSPRGASWGGSIGILLLVLLGFAFPRRYDFGPPWIDLTLNLTLAGVFLVSVATNLFHVSWRLRNGMIFVVVGLMSATNAVTLWQLVALMIFPHQSRTQIDATRLLASAVSVWLTNVLTFALLYWVTDGGGPEHRSNDLKGQRDFAFPGDLPSPGFADYVFLAFNTATAFSPTDTMPLTTRVRMMMMMESSISLIALAITAARAINILQ
jgi:uncharacterized membrane protein